MKPYSDEEAKRRLIQYGAVFIMTQYKDGEIEAFILEPHESKLEELHRGTKL